MNSSESNCRGLQKFLAYLIIAAIFCISSITVYVTFIGVLFAFLGLGAPNSTNRDAVLFLVFLVLALIFIAATIYFPVRYALKTLRLPTTKRLFLCIPAILLNLVPIGSIAIIFAVEDYSAQRVSPYYQGTLYLKEDYFTNRPDDKLARELLRGDYGFFNWFNKGANLRALSKQGRNFYWWAALAPYEYAASHSISYLAREGLKLQDGCLEFLIKNRGDEPSLSAYLIMAGADYSKLRPEDIVNPVSIRGFLESGMSPNHRFDNGEELFDIVINSQLDQKQRKPTSGAAWKIAKDVGLYLSFGGNLDKLMPINDEELTVKEWVQVFISHSKATAPISLELQKILNQSLGQQ